MNGLVDNLTEIMRDALLKKVNSDPLLNGRGKNYALQSLKRFSHFK